MKLKEFNPENSVSVKGVILTPAVGINSRSGIFNFNKPACELIGVKNADRLLILQDEDDPENWYIEKAATGFVLREKIKITKGLVFFNTSVAKKLQSSLGIKKDGFRMLLSGQPTLVGKRKLFGLLSVPEK